MKNRLLILSFFLVAFSFYLRNVSPSVTAGDSGEFITAAVTLSLPHAPSFPLFTLASRCFLQSIPWGNNAYRCNAFSALASACALLFIVLIGQLVTGDIGIGLLVAATLGVTASFWKNSLVTEVFALNTFLTAVLLWCLTRARRDGLHYYGLYAFLLGLALGNHHIVVLTVPAFLISILSPRRKPGSSSLPEVKNLDPGLRRDDAYCMALLFLFGFSIYLFLPIRARKEPPLNWGQPTTVSKLIRTITRKDYGPLTLAMGESPTRSWKNTGRHLSDFVRHTRNEIPWPALLLGGIGLVWGLRKKDTFTLTALALFLFSGPFFLILGNLPFTAQSDGIIGRFYIMPVMAFVLGGVLAFREKRWWVMTILLLSCGLGVRQGWAEASAHRHGMLVLDYGRAMLRTLPPQAALFMDGGDDAFYSLAMLHCAQDKRPDVHLHDRGGLVFKNPYGSDFRSIPKEEKKKRRWEIERQYLSRQNLFYSSMDFDALPGVRLVPVGILLEADRKASVRMDWPLLILRSLVPLEPNDYRTRALAAFFPYMRGQCLLREFKHEEALQYFRQAQLIGSDVDWLKNNLGALYATLAYGDLMGHNYPRAEKIYRQWICFDSASEQAQINLGVVFEKEGRIPEAKEQYRLASHLFPTAVDPVFNLAVLAWGEKDWPEVVSAFEEVLRRRPDHKQAEGYLRLARQRMQEKHS